MRELKNLKERFFAKVQKTDSCWNWTGGLRGGGGQYGSLVIAMDGRRRIQKFAHRLSYEMHKGKIPKGFQVCHTCDNTRCVNPDHLFVGTHTDNMHDCIKKGRDRKFVKPFVLVTPSGDVIRGENLNRFSKEKGLNESHLRGVMTGRVGHHKGYTRFKG